MLKGNRQWNQIRLGKFIIGQFVMPPKNCLLTALVQNFACSVSQVIYIMMHIFSTKYEYWAPFLWGFLSLQRDCELCPLTIYKFPNSFNTLKIFVTIDTKFKCWPCADVCSSTVIIAMNITSSNLQNNKFPVAAPSILNERDLRTDFWSVKHCFHSVLSDL